MFIINIKIMKQGVKQIEPPTQKQHKRPTLKIHQQKGSLTIQTQDIALQAIFTSSILASANYLEQFEKYCLRAALSSINLKIDQYDTYYTLAKDHIEELYNTLTYKSVLMVQDLLLSLKLVKIEMWREQTAIANGLRTHLFQKNLDPYGFRPGQFDADITAICESRVGLKESLLEELSQKMRQLQSQNMENMFSGKVQQPYLAQNKDHNEIGPSSMYTSLLGQIKLKMQKSDQTLLKRHTCIQQEIVKFMQFATEHNLRSQKIAHSVIKRYNQSSFEDQDFLLHSVSPIIDFIQKKQTFNADDLFTVKQYRSELKPAFANRNHNVEFKVSFKLFDPQKGSLVEVEQRHPQENHREWDRYGCIETPAPRVSPFDSFSEKKRNHPKEFYRLRQFQKQKYRQQQLRMRQKDRNERDRQKQKQKITSKKIIRIMPTPPPWSELTQHDFPFLYFYAQRRLKESAFWQSRQKETETQELMYSVKKLINTRSSMYTTEQRSKYQQDLPRKAQPASSVQNEQESFIFQVKRRQEQSARLIRIQKLVQSRPYDKFMNLSKWQTKVSPFCDNTTISRYGITLNVNFDHMRDLRDVETFFYRYFKQRYYRENENVKENADNPIIFLDSSKYHMNSTAKFVSQYVGSLAKKVQSMPFFVVWADDLLVYRQQTTKQGKCAQFEFYPYGNTSNSQKLMYQLRRRTQMNIKEDIKEHYGQTSELDKIYSKVQVTHRAIFDRHREMPGMTKSVTKGREIVREIFQSLRNGKM